MSDKRVCKFDVHLRKLKAEKRVDNVDNFIGMVIGDFPV